ncbi:hypothetical protein A4H97_32545 [Niastella yeongjuensis]|uniref:Lipoprotein n=1 Tax=Niastella yeongjuensis TaxID=354355 RepID=A0A1V9EGY2_9BACT|nr:hypothetical protein [Niastella yeongjuensis]OQP45400.1 hypothetical protein A4H97_32545 [Niastella yeongjuensis]SEP48319.1 hypothetical protein SAMN05660816_06749 [Niastella yeongjuensis]
MKKRNLLLCCLIATGCRETAPKETANADAAANSTATAAQSPPAEKVPMYRTTVSTEPVAEYKQKTENPLNDWYFSVKLYETSKTFQYVMKLKYEEMEGEDTLFLPNVGTVPKPVIQKGDNKYACIVGFMDNHDQFREYKKVYVKNNELKVTSLKHYSVATYAK